MIFIVFMPTVSDFTALDFVSVEEWISLLYDFFWKLYTVHWRLEIIISSDKFLAEITALDSSGCTLKITKFMLWELDYVLWALEHEDRV